MCPSTEKLPTLTIEQLRIQNCNISKTNRVDRASTVCLLCSTVPVSWPICGTSLTATLTASLSTSYKRGWSVHPANTHSRATWPRVAMRVVSHFSLVLLPSSTVSPSGQRSSVDSDDYRLPSVLLGQPRVWPNIPFKVFQGCQLSRHCTYFDNTQVK